MSAIQSQPIIHTFGRPALGRLEIESGRPIWKGPARWLTNHGQAQCSWLVGKIDSVSEVLLPDGTRSSKLRRGVPGTELWRVEEDDEVWTYGSIKLLADEITFTPVQQPQPQRWATGSLPYQLCASSNACDLVEEYGMADEVYAALCSGLWKLVGSGKEYAGPWRRAAEVVSAMRGRNEPYTDFFNSGSEGHVFDDARDLLEGMGWTFEGPLETVEASNMKALKILEIAEQKPVGDVPDWAVDWYGAFYPMEDHTRARIINCVFKGQIAPSDLDLFWQYFDIDG
ncbi:hypothetical protein G6L37_04465 [Agrobacterium rubi]|nr:hypothetical protein [Agrobacterium rubi]NTF24606.1 hypothetical protein [Agrobacterium rubi]